MLLASVGMTALGYLNDLNQPTSLDDVEITHDTLVKQLRGHYRLKITELSARHEFGRIEQES